MRSWDHLLGTFYKFSKLDPDLQEEVRRAIAYQIGCAYCMSHGCPTSVIEDKKTKVAVNFAKKVAQTNVEITEEDINQLKEFFMDSEIGELSAFISFGTGYARFGASLKVDVKISENV